MIRHAVGGMRSIMSELALSGLDNIYMDSDVLRGANAELAPKGHLRLFRLLSLYPVSFPLSYIFFTRSRSFVFKNYSIFHWPCNSTNL